MLTRITFLAPLLLAAVPAAAPPSGAASGDWYEDAKIHAGDPAEWDHFGSAIAVSGDTALVGAPDDDDAGFSSGAAYVFVRHGTGWVQQAKLTANDAAQYAAFGTSVALDGDTAVVGAPSADTTAPNTGAVYTFERIGTTWHPSAKLTGYGGTGDGFGEAVCFRGDTVVVGAPGDDGLVLNSGGAYVFTRSGSTWPQTAKLKVNGVGQGYGIGRYLAYDDDMVLIGSPRNDHAGAFSGLVYVFGKTGGVWDSHSAITASNPLPMQRFGRAVALSGDTAMIGAAYGPTGPGPRGVTFVFERTGAFWTEQAELMASDSTPGDEFGSALCLSPTRAVIGAPWALVGGYSVGAAYVLERTGTTWTERAKITTSNTLVGRVFGSTLALDGDIILAGNFRDEAERGAVHCFSWHVDALATLRNDAGGTNATSFTATPPVLGATWTATVDNTGSGNAGAAILGYENPLEQYLPQLDDWLLIDPLSPGGELLHLLPSLGTGLVTFSLTVPNDVALAGFTLSTQGGGFGGSGLRLDNAYDLVVGYDD